MVGSGKLPKEIDKFVAKEEGKLLEELTKADSFKSTLKSVTPFAKKGNQKLRNILSGSLPEGKEEKLAALKAALEVAAVEGEDEFVTEGTNILDRLTSAVTPGVDTVGLVKKLFNLQPADKNFAKTMLKRFQDIDQAKKNKERLSQLAISLGVGN